MSPYCSFACNFVQCATCLGMKRSDDDDAVVDDDDDDDDNAIYP